MKKLTYDNFRNLGEEFIKFVCHVKDLNIKYDNIPNIFISRSIINNFKKYSLIDLRTNSIRQQISFLIRIINKVIFRFNKVLFLKSKIISFYGSDGSGKSTIAYNLVNKLISHIFHVLRLIWVNLFKEIIFLKIFI